MNWETPLVKLGQPFRIWTYNPAHRPKELLQQIEMTFLASCSRSIQKETLLGKLRKLPSTTELTNWSSNPRGLVRMYLVWTAVIKSQVSLNKECLKLPPVFHLIYTFQSKIESQNNDKYRHISSHSHWQQPPGGVLPWWPTRWSSQGYRGPKLNLKNCPQMVFSLLQ